MDKLKIIVCCHKDDIYAKSDIFLPVHVGKSLSSNDLGMIGDDTGDHISVKNASYCELTGMYWAWKNLKNVDYIGLCHYRRYFDFHHIGRRFFPLTTIKPEEFSSLDISISNKVKKWLKQGYCIVARRSSLNMSLYLHYCEGHYSRDIRILGDVIRDNLSCEYFNAYWSIMVENNSFSPFNMFLMSWNQFDAYCNWLFPLLHEVEKRIDISNYPTDQKRIYGYMGERLLNIYIKARQLKVKQMPILKISDDAEIDDISTMKYIIRTLLRNVVFKLQKCL